MRKLNSVMGLVAIWVLLSACDSGPEAQTMAKSASDGEASEKTIVEDDSVLALAPSGPTGNPASVESWQAVDSGTTESETPAGAETGSGSKAGRVELDAQSEALVSKAISAGSVREIDWDTLIPEDWRPDKIMARYNVEEIEDGDPRAEKLMAELKEFWAKAPVVPKLDGEVIKMPGFVVPLEMDAEQVDEFLLVPYYGACIHVPPPPANQTVHVIVAEKGSYHGEVFDTVWITGRLRIEHFSSDLADAGYRVEAARVAPYEE